jgi:hypothetical protein
MKISELICKLTIVLAEYGDVPVIVDGTAVKEVELSRDNDSGARLAEIL